MRASRQFAIGFDAPVARLQTPRGAQQSSKWMTSRREEVGLTSLSPAARRAAAQAARATISSARERGAATLFVAGNTTSRSTGMSGARSRNLARAKGAICKRLRRTQFEQANLTNETRISDAITSRRSQRPLHVQTAAPALAAEVIERRRQLPRKLTPTARLGLVEGRERESLGRARLTSARLTHIHICRSPEGLASCGDRRKWPPQFELLVGGQRGGCAPCVI